MTRHCPTCGADILGNDPHEPGCDWRPSDYEWDQLPAAVTDRLDPGGAHACTGEGCTHSTHPAA